MIFDAIYVLMTCHISTLLHRKQSHQNKTTPFWFKSAKFYPHQNIPIYSITMDKMIIKPELPAAGVSVFMIGTSSSGVGGLLLFLIHLINGTMMMSTYRHSPMNTIT